MKELVLDLLERVYEVNQQTEHEVFFSYNPQTPQVEIRMHYEGKESDENLFLSVLYIEWEEAEDLLHKNIFILNRLLAGGFKPNDYPETHFNSKIRKFPSTGHL